MSKAEFSKTVKVAIKYFDFNKVHKFMKDVNWGWITSDGLRIPSTGDMKSIVKLLATEAYDVMTKEGALEETAMSGGFEVKVSREAVVIRFVLETVGVSKGGKVV